MRAKIFFPFVLFLKAAIASAASVSVGGQWGGLNDANSPVVINDNEAQAIQNVDISDMGLSISKCDGYAQFKTLGVSTWPVRGGYFFLDASGNENIIHTNDRSVYYSRAGGAYTAIITTDTAGSYYDFTDSQGSLWRATSNRDEIAKWDGTTRTYYPSHPKGNQIEVMPTRLVISGVAAAPNRIYFSAAADFTDFTTGILETSAFTEDVYTPGQNITAIKYAHGRLYVWTNDTLSFWAGENQFDAVIEQISATVGCNQPNSVMVENEIVYFQGDDNHFYAYDGTRLEKISQRITGSVAGFAGGASKSWAQTSEADFEAGSLTSLSTDISPGSVMLSTWTDTNTTAADFGAGTMVNTDTTTYSGRLYLSITDSNVSDNSFESGTVWTTGGNFETNTGQTGTPYDGSYVMKLEKEPIPATYNLYVLNSGGVPVSTDTIVPTINPSYNQAWEDKSKSLVAYSGQNISIKIDLGGGDTFTSETFFCSGGTMTYKSRFYDVLSEFDYFLYGKSTIFSGTFVSQTFDTGLSSPTWLSSDANWNASGHTVSAKTLTSSDGSSWDTAVAWTTGTAPTSAFKRYVRYQIDMSTTTSGTALPYVSDVTLAARSSTGTFISQSKGINSTISSWNNFNEEHSGDGTIAYFVRTASSTAMLDSATWVAVTNNSQITASTNTYVQVKATFTITAATQEPSMDNFTISWNEGVTSRTYGTVDKDARLMWSVLEGAGTANNATYIFDQRFNAWLKYSTGFNAPAMVGDSIYFGDADSGTTYVYPSGTSAAGSAITAYWKSKDFIGSNPFVEKNWTRYSVIAKAETASNLDVTISTNTLSGTAYNFSLADSQNATLKRINANIKQGTVGTFFNIRFGNDDTDAPFDIYTFEIEFEPRAWRVMP